MVLVDFCLGIEKSKSKGVGLIELILNILVEEKN